MSKYFDEEIEKNANEKFKKHIVDILTIKDNQIADLEAKFAQAKMNESFEKEKKDNAFKLIKELKQQLAEKEKEIEYLTKQAKRFNNEAQKYFEDAYCNDAIYQDKISFCIEQLEKVLPSIKATIELAENRHQMKDQVDIIIDNQIKTLGGEK